MNPDTKKSHQTFGTELDLLPYISNGYYLSAWYGTGRFRIRGVLTKTTIPGFMLKDGFKDNKLTVYAGIVDYFFNDNFKGAWVGAGFEAWESEIRNENSSGTATYNNKILTLGGGYVWKFFDNFYLNPWAALHYIVGGETEIRLGNSVHKPGVLTPEVSIKLGWHF
ncbi:MAG: hypothetical protein HBSAPP04_14370 [Ignavibacteriaceae bacterium]|nr:MAG: hypothetical protein HBSAPP04_14370 [Ignavibacteriaceae bacterium]